MFGMDSGVHVWNPRSVRFTHAHLHRFALPLRSPFRTSYGVETARHGTLVHLTGPDGEGWGECVAEVEPHYSPEYADGAYEVMKRFLLPRLDPRDVDATRVAERFAAVQGNHMAKAAVEAAVWDAQCRMDGLALAERLGTSRARVPAGVAVGIQPSVGALVDAVHAYVDQGYGRVKLKIEPGNDVAQVRAVREAFGDGLMIQVDANGAYSLADSGSLRELDAFGLALIEQPLPRDDLFGHARLAEIIRTPICLDESITSVREAAEAITLGACSVINVKPARVGGLAEALRIHDLCLVRGIDLWCGGMLETGVGRALNVALAALPGFTLPGDLSASDRYFERDLTEPFVLADGHLAVPRGPGIGVTPLADVLNEFVVASETITL